MSDMTTQTLSALEQRLRRITFLLRGDDSQTLSPDSESSDATSSIASRLNALEKSLHVITNKSASAAELLRLHKQYPTIWDEAPTTDDTDAVPDDALASMVLAHTPAYHTTAAQLTSLNDLPVPDSSSSASLVALQSRIQRTSDRQEQQAKAINRLREQSVAVIGRWYESGIVAMGDCWNEWDARLLAAERTVRQAEGRKKRQEEEV